MMSKQTHIVFNLENALYRLCVNSHMLHTFTKCVFDKYSIIPKVELSFAFIRLHY